MPNDRQHKGQHHLPGLVEIIPTHFFISDKLGEGEEHPRAVRVVATGQPCISLGMGLTPIASSEPMKWEHRGMCAIIVHIVMIHIVMPFSACQTVFRSVKKKRSVLVIVGIPKYSLSLQKHLSFVGCTLPDGSLLLFLIPINQQ